MPGIDALLSKEITCIMEDNDGSLWLATNNNGIVHVTVRTLPFSSPVIVNLANP